MTHEEKRTFLIRQLLYEKGKSSYMPMGEEKDKRLLRSLLNTRPPLPVTDEFRLTERSYLIEAAREKGIVRFDDIPKTQKGPRLFKGDITALKCGAVVNAANERLLGCFTPCHGCVDNAIHTYAGTELRLRCSHIIKELGRNARIAEVFVTSAYCLPCDYIFHVTGPAPRGMPDENHKRQLAECYENCLDKTLENGLESIAFCCLSSGVFGFPKKQAAKIAINTVMNHRAFREGHTHIIFAVYDDENYSIYNELLNSSL